MVENSAAVNQGCAFDHDLWLTVRSAHNRYQCASAALTTVMAMPPSPERNLWTEAAAAEQRAAFESYIEARLQLTESMISPSEPPVIEPENSWRNFRIAPPVLLAAAACLFPLAFAVGNFVGQRREARESEAVQQEANAKLAQMRSQVEALSRTTETLKTGQPAPARNPEITPAAARGPRRLSQVVRKPARSSGRIARNHQEVRLLAKRGERNYYEFLITDSQHSERIGRIRLTVLKAVPGRHFSDLSIAVDNLTPNRRRVNLDEPVWISLNGRPKAVELVVNRIDGNRVGGYLSEPKYRRVT
jgi:hypothetical protein